MKSIIIIGAGFSGLCLGYFLKRHGLSVTIYERESTGGLIQTLKTEFGLVETAANGMIATATIEQMALDLGLELVTAKKQSRRRYIYHETLSRWPLSHFKTASFAGRLLIFMLYRKRLRPRPKETLKEWTTRVFGNEFYQRIAAVAPQGIYAGQPERLSASLVMSRLFQRKQKNGKLHGIVAPRGGMADWIAALQKNLTQSGVVIRRQEVPSEVFDLSQPVVVATSVSQAAELLKTSAPSVSQRLTDIETLPLVSTTLFFSPVRTSDRPKGFGILFSQKSFHGVLGVLLNEQIFEGRSPVWSETWILGGAFDRSICTQTDEQIMAQILKCRQAVFKIQQTPLAKHIFRWPQALPHYTIELESILQDLILPKNLYLAGNYLGALGLSAMVEHLKHLAQRIANEF